MKPSEGALHHNPDETIQGTPQNITVLIAEAPGASPKSTQVGSSLCSCCSPWIMHRSSPTVSTTVRRPSGKTSVRLEDLRCRLEV